MNTDKQLTADKIPFPKVADSLSYFESNCMRMTGVFAGKYLDDEDFERYAKSQHGIIDNLLEENRRQQKSCATLTKALQQINEWCKEFSKLDGNQVYAITYKALNETI